MPLILGTNSIKDTGYDVANSLRFDDGSSDYINRTPSGAGNRKTWTFSIWFKRSNISLAQKIFSVTGGGSNNFECYFNTNDTLAFYHYSSNGGVTDSFLGTNQVFRDTSAWYHLVLAVDTTQATASNRVKMYVNGSQITSFSTAIYFNQNYDTYINSTNEHRIGANLNNSQYFDGYMCETVLVDGSQLGADSFGEFDSATGIWKPISVSGLTFGTNGFYLDFENSGSLGADVSGNGNNFTVNNLTSIDQTTDTCTNNFATFNALNQQSSISYSNGNTTFTNSSSANRMAFSNIGVTKGKYYSEIKVGAVSNYMRIGIADISKYIPVTNAYLTNISNSANYSNDGVIFIGSSSQGTFSTFTTNDIVNIALDMDNGYVYFGKNGTWQNSGDPTSGGSGTGGFAISNYSTETYCFGLSSFDGGTDNVANANFGNGYFGTTAVSSAQNPDDGIGIFEYDVPAGYRALCTKSINAEEYS